MAKSQMTERDEKREVSRRALIKWSVAAGAALGVSRARVFEVLEKTAGKGIAQAAAARTARTSVHMDLGNGGIARWTQLIPFPAIAANTGNANNSWGFPGQDVPVTGADFTMVTGPATPRADLAKLQWTGIMAGTNDTHNSNANTSNWNLGANAFPAIATVLQAGDGSVLPAIQVGGVPLGTAPGSAQATGVGNSAGMVGLFNSAASQAGGLLSNAADATLYKAQYDAFIQLNRAANRSTTKQSYLTAQGAAKFLGTNLAAQLQVNPDDLTRYFGTTAVDAATTEIARTLITTAKAFKLGLTNSVALKGQNDDPHGLFDNGQQQTSPLGLKMAIEGFLNDLQNNLDSITQQPMIGNFVMTVMGDTYKDTDNKNGWGDGTNNNSNVIYVFHPPGDMKTGWWGKTSPGTVQGWDATGALVTYNAANQTSMALSAICYSIAIRDDRAIQSVGATNLPSALLGAKVM